MKLGTEHREQVYILTGLLLFAGYMLYTNLAPKRQNPASLPAPHRPADPRSPRKAVGWVELNSGVNRGGSLL